MQQQQRAWSLLAALVLAVIGFPATLVIGFSSRPSFAHRHSTTTRIQSNKDPVDAAPADIDAEKLFPEATILEFTLEHHKPLGCTVEESLAHPMEKHVFITKVRLSTTACDLMCVTSVL